LLDDDGQIGYGEATPLPAFGTESLVHCEKKLDLALAGLVDGRARSFEGAIAHAGRLCRDAPCALSALDSALHDLEARRAGSTLAEWIGQRVGRFVAADAATRSDGRNGANSDGVARVRVQALLGGDSPEAVEVAARAARARGFETFKLKLASSGGDTEESGDQGHERGRAIGRDVDRSLARDLERVAALRSVIGPGCRIRLDANEGFTVAEAHAAMRALQPYAIDYLEQPVARSDLAGLRELDVNGVIAVAADEALLGAGLDACLAERAASIFVVKPAALGGIAPAMEVFRRAREAGLRIVWSSLIDGAVGRAGALALAGGLGPEQEVHGLGTAGLLARDLIDAPTDTGAVLEMSVGPGLGCAPRPAWQADDSSGEEILIVEAPR
jgi:L-alanine-DL-glutamate epimerase-like enolase superfamily enzyme